MFPKTPQYFKDVFPMFGRIIGLDEYIVKVHDDAYIKQISKDVIHETMKDRGTVGQAEWHNLPFEQAVTGSECSFPLVVFGDSD
jgi:hypothetical protein